MKKVWTCLLILALLAAPAAMGEGESEQIAALEARIEELEAENAELRALLSQEESARLLAARFNGGVITVEEAKAEYEYRAYFYQEAGMDPAEYEDIIKEEVLGDLTEDAILRLKAQELGVYEPSAEEEAEIRRRAEQSLNEMVDYYLAFQSDPEKSEEENRQAVIAFLAEEGTTLESLVESMSAQDWRDRLIAAATGELRLDEEQLRAYYDQACATAELSYAADPQSYENDRMNGEAVLWNPEGYRRVKRILIAFDEESAARMVELSALLEQTGDENEVSELLAQMDELYALLDPIVEEVLGRIEAGDDFNLLIDEYGADPYMQSGAGREDGYYVSAASANLLLDEEFVTEAMALAQPGDVSGPVECADGVYVLRYEADVAPGAVDYAQFLADEDMRDRVEESARSEYYYELVEQWIVEAEVETYPENF